MKNLTTPTAILIGLGLIAVAVASIPYSNGVISTANAQLDLQDYSMFSEKLTDINTSLGQIYDAIGNLY